MLKRVAFISGHRLGCLLYSTRLKAFKYLSTPVKTGVDESKLPPPTKIDEGTIEYLERVSLVGFENERAVKIVEGAIRFADQIFEVDTDNVEPMVTVLEDECLLLREDVEKQDVTRGELLSHCEKTIENYYITPSENVKGDPLTIRETNHTKALVPFKKVLQN